MAIAHAAGSAYVPSGSNTSFVTSFTVPAGDNRLLVVKVLLNYASVTTATVSSVTFGAQSLTKTDGAAANMTVGTQARSEIWTLVAPATGAGTVTVTTSGQTRMVVVMEAYTGVHQTTPLGTYVSATGTNTSPTVTVTSATDEMVVDALAFQIVDASISFTVESGQTKVSTAVYYGGGSILASAYAAASYETGAASTVMSWDIGNAGPSTAVWSTGGVPIKPATAGGGGAADPPAPPAGATLGVGIAEVGIVPKRTAPSFSPAAGALSTLENPQADFEASGMFPKVLQGTQVGDTIIWDDVWTVPSVAPAGAISISALPTRNSPTASLLVATQDLLVQYPLPVSGSPTTTAYPQLPLAATTTAEAQTPENLLPIFYPSAFDSGGRLLELVAVQCVGQNFTDEVDAWAISVRPDDTEPWSDAVRQKSAEALFWMTSGNYGRTWRIAASILDGDQDDPIGPSGSQIIGWFREIVVDPATYSQRARAIPEVS